MQLYERIYEYYYYYFTKFVLSVYVFLASRGLVLQSFKNRICLSGNDDTNASTMMWLRCLYTLEPAENRYDEREYFWARHFMKPHFIKRYNYIKKKGIIRLPVPLRSLYAAYYARAHCSRTFVEKAIADGYKQIIILGSGFDFLAFKYYNIPDVKFYEIDLLSVQTVKKAKLAEVIRHEIDSIISSQKPTHYSLSEMMNFWREVCEKENRVVQKITYLPCDFTENYLHDLLVARTNVNAKTLVLWEGVTYYIPRAAVETTLATLATVYSDHRLFFDAMCAEPVDSWFWNKAKTINILHNTHFECFLPDCKDMLTSLGYSIMNIHNRYESLENLKNHEYYRALFIRYPEVHCLVDLIVFEVAYNKSREKLAEA